ncbi:MAG TPA: hypothetical protein VK498_04785, partial [Ferruginibacter sp.]|nr:hypothetical protein [Ferruginibacter sp.]
QTTGGYPRVAHIITAHLPALAQMKAGESIRLKPVDISIAEELLFSQQHELQLMKDACFNNLNKYYARH